MKSDERTILTDMLMVTCWREIHSIPWRRVSLSIQITSIGREIFFLNDKRGISLE